ncbi:MAG: NADH-quinone oxidoreductase subunit L [Fibrobacter sp.]|nr:NADH-quinone oxidoreductase subunit L [Fibrobacter sp.]
MTNLPLWFIPLFPLIGCIVLGAIALISSGSKKGPSEGIVGALSVLFPALAFVSVVLLSFNMPEGGIRSTLCNWIDIPMFNVDIGFLFDSLSRIMLLFVTGIGTLIAMYSLGYMHGDRGFARFFAYINLFLFSMIVLVLSDSLLFTFLGWEGVGLCSYLLIGFWNHDVNNCKAANKAFIVNRVGDIGFLLGMLLLMTIGGSNILNYDALNAFINMIMGSAENANIVVLILSIAGICFFIGCTGKSAQIPLLTWLPDAMAGPTPVSALIHAATMVTSGVYLLARLSTMFVHLTAVLHIIVIIGMLTAFWAAVAGLFQNDIKKVLAYSTVSQLGYMFMASGAAAFDASIFHVFTHAFFKAALFLGAGAVIHSLAGEQDMRKMGGLLKKTPVTACVMIFAFLAIIGIPGFSGFWSKDLILERLYMMDWVVPVEFTIPLFNLHYSFEILMNQVVYVVGLLTAVITAVYMSRLIILTFFGSYRGSKESEAHIHEAPATMLIPMVILAFGAVFAGYFWADSMGIKYFEESLAPVVGAAQAVIHHSEAHVGAAVFAGLGTLAALLGMGIAWAKYGKARIPAAKGSSAPQGKMATWTFFWDYVHGVVITVVNAIAWVVDSCVDKLVQFAQWLVGGIAEILGDGAASFQVRKVRLQIALSIAGVAALVIVVLLTGGLI